jgi:hypothetical protein
MNALTKSTQRLATALDRASRAKRGNIMRARFQLEQARTEHLKNELKQERRK